MKKKNNNLSNKNEIQYLLKNTYNNVKIYPTTFLNNKIIYQTENNNINNPNNNKTMRIYTKNNIEKKESVNKNTNYENANSVEEVHFLYVKTIQNGKKLILKWDKFND